MKKKNDIFINIISKTDVSDIYKEINNIKVDSLPDNGYSIPMLIYYAMLYSNNIVDNVPRLSSSDHITVFRILNTLIQKFVNRECFTLGDYRPYFNDGLNIDSDIMNLFNQVNECYMAINLIVSLQEKYWSVSLDNNVLRFSIPENMRRSGLYVIGMKAEYLSYNDKGKDILDNPDKHDPIELALNIGINELNILSQGIPKAWEKFLSCLPYSSDNIISFQGFISALRNYSKIWFTNEDLWDSWHDYISKYNQNEISKEVFESLVIFYSITPEESVKWGLQAPFIKIGDWYAYWFFYFHIMNPNLSLISLWVRKHQKLWDNTIGASMAGVSTFIMKSLPEFDRVIKISERKRKLLGDVDLALYDIKENHLILCEVKTVFDKFRTNYQYSNFHNQKVNFDKANEQLRRNEAAISSGNWTLKELLNTKIDIIPKTITLIILTWWDIVNANAGTEKKDILCCNFRTFKYLFEKSKGDLDLFVGAIREFGSIYCPAALVYCSVNYNSEEIPYIREMQTDVLPPLNMLKGIISNELVKDEIISLAKFPDDWREQMIIDKEDPNLYHFY